MKFEEIKELADNGNLDAKNLIAAIEKLDERIAEIEKEGALVMGRWNNYKNSAILHRQDGEMALAAKDEQMAENCLRQGKVILGIAESFSELRKLSIERVVVSK